MLPIGKINGDQLPCSLVPGRSDRRPAAPTLDDQIGRMVPMARVRYTRVQWTA